MQLREFDPPLGRIFSGRGEFSLGVNMGFDSIPNSDESVNRGLVCAHMHSIAPAHAGCVLVADIHPSRT